MGYYNYHAKLKQKIKDGELEKFEFVDSYKNSSPYNFKKIYAW